MSDAPADEPDLLAELARLQALAPDSLAPGGDDARRLSAALIAAAARQNRTLSADERDRLAVGPADLDRKSWSN